MSTLCAHTVASNTLAKRNIIQGREANGIEQWIDESKGRFLPSSESGIVEETKDGCDNRRSGRCSSRRREFTSIYDLVVRTYAVRADIRESTSSEIGIRGVVLLDSRTDVKVQVRLNSEFLICGTGEVVAEATRAAYPSLFWAHRDSSSDSGDIWTSARELGCELWCSLPVVALARTTDSVVSRRFKDRDTAETHHAYQVADLDGVFLGDGLLVIPVGVRDDLW